MELRSDIETGERGLGVPSDVHLVGERGVDVRLDGGNEEMISARP